MGLLKDSVTPELGRIRTELKKLGGMKIHIGVQGGTASGEQGGSVIATDTPATLLTIAGVHEYGMVIKAKHVKNLTIPISPNAKGKRAGDFNDLFVYTADTGNKFLAREKGKTGIELLFWLVPSVTIPERSFIRGSYDSGGDKLYRAGSYAISQIIGAGWDAGKAADFLGLQAVKMVKEYFTGGGLKSKSETTLASDGRKTTPLMDTGRLRNSITFRIEEG